MLIPIELPSANDSLDFVLYDYNATSRDEYVANIHFSIKELDARLEKEKFILQWFNLYGGHQKNSGKIVDEQNKEPEKATTYKGRILLEIRSKTMDQPVLKIHPVQEKDKYFDSRLSSIICKFDNVDGHDLNNDDHEHEAESSEEEMAPGKSALSVPSKDKKAMKKPRPPDKIVTSDTANVFDKIEKFVKQKSSYQIVFHFGSGIMLPKNENYNIKVQIGDQIIETSESDIVQSPKKAAKYERFVRWSKTVSVKFDSPYHKLEQLPDMFIYLMHDSKELCYIRDRLQKY